MSSSNPIYVTQPYLPPLSEFTPYLERIWENKILTNCGPYHQELEDSLCRHLNVNHISLFSNGTIALITALQALNISGEVITTPYSFVATSHSLLWNRIKPVFVDIEPNTLNIDPLKIQKMITPETSAILPVHCYGNPCNTAAIAEIAYKNNLKTIYDACHAFGVKDEHGSILLHGDLSVLSFHATKVFNTFEGGAIISPNIEMKRRIDNLKNFGFIDELTVVAEGINGKMSEINAAFGLLQLKYIDKLIEKRAHIDSVYRNELHHIKGIKCVPQTATIKNYSYFPILIDDEYPLTRDELYNKLKSNNIIARRYFYPLISEFPMYKNYPSSSSKNLNCATEFAKKILCLPIYPSLLHEEQNVIIDLITKA